MEKTHYVEHQISIFGKHDLNNTMSNFIVLTCACFQSVTGREHVNSRDANTCMHRKEIKCSCKQKCRYGFIYYVHSDGLI
jgi:hypothetical protein